MNNPQNDQNQRNPKQQGQGDKQPAQQQQDKNKDRRKPNDNTIPEVDADDQSDSPQMSEGRESEEGDTAPSVRRGALNTQYGTDSSRPRGADAPKTVQGSTDEAPDARGSDQSTGAERDTLSTGGSRK